ncbi:uncharacterized protein LOC143228218 [Tachypleus tridentatus]|uniref:uncharacterized protein LOC143228218 n=1 Tax=Tachypleus tridentatus TaxID=6853 RepID=UPI003FD13EAE
MTESRNPDSREMAFSYHNEIKIVESVDDLGLLPSKISDNLNLDVDATNLSAQVCMENWQDWVDVQWSDIPKPRAKLRVSLASNAGASDEEIAVVELWRMKLRQKFQINRQRIDSSLPIVQERKKKMKAATDESPSPNHISEQRLYGLKQYLCEKPVGEDETSIEKHKEWMKTRLHCRKKG